jgi:hypothetical protein
MAPSWRAPARRASPMPLAFTDEELDLLHELARPISQSRRSEFLAAVAAELQTNGHAGGVGLVHQTGRVIQRRFWHPPAETGAEPRHDGPKTLAGR